MTMHGIAQFNRTLVEADCWRGSGYRFFASAAVSNKGGIQQAQEPRSLARSWQPGDGQGQKEEIGSVGERAGFNTMRTVLLVEDDPWQAVLVHRKIGRDVVLMHASTLADGVGLLRFKKADVVLLDLTLPDSVREETLARFKHSHPAIPIILITGQADPDFIERSILNNCYGVIVKDKTDAREQILTEIEGAIECAGDNQVLKRIKEERAQKQ